VGHYRFFLPHHIQTVSYPNVPIPLANTPDPVQQSRIGGSVQLPHHTPSLRGIYQKHKNNLPSTGRQWILKIAVLHTMVRTQTEGVREQGTEEYVWFYGGSRLETTA